MVEEGLIDETKKLSAKYGWSSEPMRSIGYSQWRGYFEGTKTKDEAIQQIISSTNRFAKRQTTWFKRNKNIAWVKDLPEAEKLVKGFVSKFGTINPDES
jgi:tRNA dimethylallyltransferase